MNNKNNLWGGRFTKAPDQKFVEFNRSFNFDCRLFAADVRVSVAHCEGLRIAEVLTAEEANLIKSALLQILENGTLDLNYLEDTNVEDVHSFVDTRLIEMIGDAGRKLHTGRSRNDQVATSLRFWLRENIEELCKALAETQKSLLDLAEKHHIAVLPGYTHMQRAQPVLFAHWCLAYFEMLRRDAERLVEARARTNVLPLGAAALAGTSYPIARETVAKELRFDSITRNSLDAVSDRDFAVEFVSAASLILVHLSRLAEDIILYATAEFDFFELSDAVATGSSIMPQKKNPDSMELVRGKSGRVFGHLTALLTVLKGLPLAYNKDLQEDKEAVFDTYDTTLDCLQVTEKVLQNTRVKEDKTVKAAVNGYLNATELADYLARKGVPFREAHETAGKIVLRAIELEVEIEKIDLTELRNFSHLIESDIFEALSLEQTLNSKNTIGGTAPARVSEALREARQYLTEFSSQNSYNK